MKKREGKGQPEFDFPKIDELPFDTVLNTEAEKMKIVFPSNNFTQEDPMDRYWRLITEVQFNKNSGNKFK